MAQKIDKEVFDTFFRESYIPVEYSQIRQEFEEIAADPAHMFSREPGTWQLTEKTFVMYMQSDVYGELEGCVEEAFAALNPEIVDAVMDVAVSQPGEESVTSVYWETLENLLHDFLKQLYREKFAKGTAESYDGRM